MNWKEFVASAIDSLVWPVAIAFIVYLLREPLRRRLGELRKLRYRDAEAEFGEYVQGAEIAATQAELPSPEPTSAEPALSSELWAEISTAPRAAVIEAWLAVERELEALAERAGVLGPVGPAAPHQRVPTHILVNELVKRRVIDPGLASVITDLRDARDVAAHVRPYTVERDEVVDYVKLAGRVRGALRLAKQAQEAAMEGRTAYDLLVYHDLSDPTKTTGGSIPSVGDNGDYWFGDIGRDRHVVAVGPGIHEGRVTVVLAHGNRPMPELQGLLDRQAEE